MVIPAIIGPMGILCYGLVIAAQDGWVGAAVGYGMQGFGATAASNIIITYAVDAYRPVSLLRAKGAPLHKSGCMLIKRSDRLLGRLL